MAKEIQTRKNYREETARMIKEAADFGSDGAIQSYVNLIEHCLKEGKYDEIKQHLDGIRRCCVREHCQRMQSFHAFEMMRHFALAIGEKYDPMY